MEYLLRLLESTNLGSVRAQYFTRLAIKLTHKHLINVSTHMLTRTHTPSHEHTHTYTHRHKQTRMHYHARTLTHAHTHTHTHTHTQK